MLLKLHFNAQRPEVVTHTLEEHIQILPLATKPLPVCPHPNYLATSPTGLAHATATSCATSRLSPNFRQDKSKTVNPGYFSLQQFCP